MTRHAPRISDVVMLQMYAEPRKRKLVGRWHITQRPCPKCGRLLACDGKSLWVCNRCEYTETRDVRKYAKLGAHFRDSVTRFRFGDRD